MLCLIWNQSILSSVDQAQLSKFANSVGLYGELIVSHLELYCLRFTMQYKNLTQEKKA